MTETTYERGFTDSFLRRPSQIQTITNRTAREQYERGERVAWDILNELGGNDVLNDTIRLQRRAKLMYETFSQSWTDGFRAASPCELTPDPCMSCPWIAVCAATGRTCPMFRRYVSRVGKSQARVPDRVWSDSWYRSVVEFR